MQTQSTQISPIVDLKDADLPAYCPNPSMPLWSSHPKVYLELSHEGLAKCPYCGTTYRLKAMSQVAGH